MFPKWFYKTPPGIRPLLIRLGFNWLPAWRATGGRVVHVSPDLKRIVVALRLNRGTRNAVGTIFGGSLYAATDGLHPTLLMLNLGPEYIIWDKAGAIRYKRPGRAPLFAEFHVDDAEIETVRRLVAENGECDRTYNIEMKDGHGVVHTVVERVVYIASKAHYRNKRAA